MQNNRFSSFKEFFTSSLNLIAVINGLLLILFGDLSAMEKQPIFSLYYNCLSGGIFIGYLVSSLGTQKFKYKSFRHHLFDIFFLIVYFITECNSNLALLYILGRQTVSTIKKLAVESWEGLLYRKLTENPAVFFMFSFIFIIMTGAVLLSLPVSTVTGEVTSFLDALFTSTSATCVTGLIVHDTGSHFTMFGQLIILLLIQVGGLGIMTISTSFAILLGQRLTLRSEQMMQNVIGESNKIDSIRLIQNVVAMTFFFEALGAILLFFVFRNSSENINPVYNSIFHSISAFCNAGFSLYSDSFMKYYSNPLLNLTITSLIIVGGIGFSVIIDIRRLIVSKRKNISLTLHSKLVLITSGVLLFLGTIMYFASEYNHTMKDFTLWERICSSYFQSVTTRTAGFNTIDLGNLSNASVFISLFFMLIGASPGSTGGGIKTTTVALIFLSVYSVIHGQKNVFAFRRKIMDSDIRKVLALLAMALGFLFFSVFLLTLFETNISFNRLIFEAVSAFGTVGLSMNTTGNLTQAGKIIIIAMMYLGRVGPLTIIFALSEQKRISDYTYIEEKVSIG